MNQIIFPLCLHWLIKHLQNKLFLQIHKNAPESKIIPLLDLNSNEIIETCRLCEKHANHPTLTQVCKVLFFIVSHPRGGHREQL